MSCGSAGAKQERATDSHPGKSLVLGLLGAALGKKRSDPWHDVSKSYGFAVMTVRGGQRMEDYHTVATPRKGLSFRTRLEEVEASDYTVETWREYLSDAYFVFALWGLSDEAYEEAKEALIRPTFEIFAGRKSCPLSLPPAPEVIEAETLAKAFREYGRKLYPGLKPSDPGCILHWESHPNPGVESDRVYQRKDQVENREKRLFRDRSEHESILTL